MKKNDAVEKFEKCATLSMLTTLVCATVGAIKRFKDVPQDELVTKAYQSIKDKAAA